MKLNRRKQTNPNRVSAGTRASDLIVPSGVNDVPTSQDEESHKEAMEDVANGCRQTEQVNGQSLDNELPLDMHVSVFACHYCSETFPNLRKLETHEAELHGPAIKKVRLDLPCDVFPTAYHRLGRELQENSDAPLSNGHLENEFQLPAPNRNSSPVPTDSPHSPPSKIISSSEKLEEGIIYQERHHPPNSLLLKSGKESNGEPINGKSDRIFHMDAYCELCDREFCNKYFLKTHKANKHGIYEANSPPANTVPAPFPGLLIPQDPLTSFSFKMDSMKPHLSEPLLPWSFKMDSPSQQEKISDVVTSSVRSTDPSVSVFSAPLPLIDSPKSTTNKSTISSYDNVNARSLVSSSSTFSNSISVITSITNSTRSGPTSSVAPPSNDSSMEDYCQICQKHFCNKYYLKKHKQDVHGIVPENSPSNCTKRSRSGILDLPMTQNNPMMLPQPLSSLAGMHGLSGMPGLSNMHSVPPIPSMPPGVMVINPYTLPPVAIIPAGSLMPGHQIPPPPHHASHPMISQSMSIAPVPESILHNHTPPTTISLASSNSTGHLQSKSSPSIHDSGVHCNICTKEFCNEFYLQIHKESKHGIRRSFEEEFRDNALPLVKEAKDDKPFSPLISDNGKIEPFTPQALDPLARRTPSDGGVLICNLCNKDYTNRYLFRIHRIHDHGLNELTDPLLAESGEIPHKDRILQNESLIRMSADPSAVGYASSFDASSSSSSNNHQEPAVCDICNKPQLSQYSLRLHKFNIHGIDQNISEKYDVKMNCSPSIYNSKPKTPTSSGSLSTPSPGQQQQQQPLNLTPLPGKHPLLPFLPPKIDFKDMSPFVDFSRDFKGFREMPSFLTDTIGSELFVRSQNQAMHMDLNLFGLPSFGKVPMDDGIKLNFDPEAYCEICKKEFCSKYFLRTHKQNIHGIKSDTPSSTSSKSSDNDKTSTVTQMKPINGSICSNSSNKPRDSLDKNSWRWKEPMNSSRVICDICNKEVCNKYFLRTHKQKKHGIAATPQSPNISTSGSPVASDCDTTSNASSQLDEKPFRMDVFCLPPMIPLPPTERMPEKFHIKLPNFDKVSSEILPFNNNIEQNETCNICSRRFKNMKWLKDHIVKDHTDPGALDMRAKCSTPVYTCQVCGIHFPAELSIQLHLIQEHNARVTVDSEETQIPTEEANLPNSEGSSNKVAELCGRWTLRKKVSNHQRVKKYVCNRCGFDSHWLSSLLDHERNEHGIMSDFSPAYSCKICHHMVPSPKSLSGHLVTVHGLTIEDARHEIELAEPVIPNSFKCVHCPAVFPTRSWGMAHVRHVHIRSRRDLAVKNMYVKNLFRCPSCPFKTHFAFRLQQHVKCRHVSCLRPSSSNRSSQSFSSPSSSSSSSSSSSLITSTSSLRKRCDAPGPRTISKGDTNLVTASAVYKSIAASLLSAPETVKGESPRESIDRESLLLQSYQLPLGTSPVDSSSFKMAIQASASAVVGL